MQLMRGDEMGARGIVVVLSMIASLCALAPANAKGPFGTIHVGNWIGGAFTNDATGVFTHCGASARYANGVELALGKGTNGYWLLGFQRPTWSKTPGQAAQIDITFDGQSQLRLFASVTDRTLVIAFLPSNAALEQIRKSHLMAVVIDQEVFQFALASTEELLPAIARCFDQVKSAGITNLGDFSRPPAGAARPKTAAAETGPKPAKGKDIEVSGTGFVISASGHVVTNHHVISHCASDINGTISNSGKMKLRVVANDETNDLALLQAPTMFKDVAAIRGTPVRSGDAIVAIGYPYHGLLTSDFTVTTGIVSSLSGILNDTRFLQISAPVQPGNSGGPLFDASGDVVGIVAEKINALKFAKLSGGDLPENINFAIKTGALRDFLDNSVVSYKTVDPGPELKTGDIANNARAFTMLISCTANGVD